MVELCGAIFLVLVFIRLKTSDDIAPQVRGILMGGALLINMCCFYNVSGACFNPALIFGPSFLSRYLTEYQWIYYFGPVLGAVLGSAAYQLYEYFIDGKKPEVNSKKDDRDAIKFDIERKGTEVKQG